MFDYDVSNMECVARKIYDALNPSASVLNVKGMLLKCSNVQDQKL